VSSQVCMDARIAHQKRSHELPSSGEKRYSDVHHASDSSESADPESVSAVRVLMTET
ncbi:hypothetical protein M9458_039018, partial [Cirrhinus mrigala]